MEPDNNKLEYYKKEKIINKNQAEYVKKFKDKIGKQRKGR